jgi:dimethylhistidine N-methyltransferase
VNTPANLSFHDLAPSLDNLQTVVVAGLAQRRKRLPPKLFYDADGSALFDAITALPEYYPTRTEIGLLRRHGEEMASLLGADVEVVELGSGSDVKIRLLLDALRPKTYMPVDISGAHLLRAATAIARDYPDLGVHALCADYTRTLALPEAGGTRRAAFFPGSSIGNFEPSEVVVLLGRIAGLLGPGGRLIVGVDIKKAPGLLHAAYNDSRGITAAFNRNLLARINRELGGDFDLDAFEHRAFYDKALGRIEMHLVARSAQRVRIDGHRFAFAPGESIHTENSYKYGVTEFLSLAASAGYTGERVWLDDDRLFSVHCLRVA